MARREYPRYGRLDFRVSGDGSLYNIEPFVAEIAPRVVETVPPGFRSDLASIPGIARWWLAPTGPWTKPAFLHDWHYAMNGIMRKEADRRFLHGMETQGTPWLQRQSMYYAVRAFGWWVWRKHRS